MDLFLQTTASQLHLAMVRYEDRGRYRCVADNFKTNATVSDYANITISREQIFINAVSS